MKKITKKPQKTSKIEYFDRKYMGKLCHDLKNPLTIMKVNLELIGIKMGKKIDPKTKKLVKLMNQEIDRMVKIISNVG